MDLHICSVKYIKGCFMLCEHAANQENGASSCYKVLLVETSKLGLLTSSCRLRRSLAADCF